MKTAVHIDTQLYNSAAVYARQQHTSVDKMVENYILMLTIASAEGQKNNRPLPVTEIQRKLYDRLDEMRQLEYDWDDEGAVSIKEEIIDIVSKLVDAEGGKNMEQWVIFPDTNGTLMLEAKHRDATISIGTKEFSYVYHTDKHDESANHLPLSLDTLVQIMKHINE